MGVLKTSDHNQIKIKIPNPSQEPPVTSKALNEDLKDMDVLCTFRIKRERAKIWIIVASRTNDHIQIKIKIPNQSQEPLVCLKVPNQDSKDMDVLFTFKMKIESQNSEHWCIKDQIPYLYQNQDAIPKSGIFNILKCPK